MGVGGAGLDPLPAEFNPPTPAQFFPPYPHPLFFLFFRVPPPRIKIFSHHPAHLSPPSAHFSSKASLPRPQPPPPVPPSPCPPLQVWERIRIAGAALPARWYTTLCMFYGYVYLFVNQTILTFQEDQLYDKCVPVDHHLRGLIGTRPSNGEGSLYREFEELWHNLNRSRPMETVQCEVFINVTPVFNLDLRFISSWEFSWYAGYWYFLERNIPGSASKVREGDWCVCESWKDNAIWQSCWYAVEYPFKTTIFLWNTHKRHP